MGMILSHSRPDLDVTVTAGAILSDTARLTNNRPRSVTRFQWPSGAQTTATTMGIQTTWAQSFSPRVVGLMNTTLPAGTKVEFQIYDGAGFVLPSAPNTQRVVQLPNGSRHAWIVLPAGLDSIDRVRPLVYNDVNGVASIAADSTWDLGEYWVGPAEDFVIKAGHANPREDSTKVNWTRRFQPFIRSGSSRRNFNFTPKLSQQIETYGDPGDSTALDLDALFSKIDRGQPAVCIERWQDSAGAYSPYLVHRTVKFGVITKLPGEKHMAGQYFDFDTGVLAEIAMA